MAETDTKSRELFRRLRGSPVYMNYLRGLSETDLFTRLSTRIKGSDPWIESQGYEIGVFQHHLVENWFFPTFELDKNAAKIELFEEFQKSKIFCNEWDRWDRFKLRLTRNGFIQIKLTRKFKRERLHQLGAQLLEFERDELRTELYEKFSGHRREERPYLQHTLQWQLTYEIIKLFIRQHSVFDFDKNGIVRFQMPVNEEKTPIRDKYTIIFLRELSERVDESATSLRASDILRDKRAVQCIRSLWDGTLYSENDGTEIRYPDYDERAGEQVRVENLSCLQDEFSLVGGERAVIYCPLSHQAIHLPFRGGETKRGVRYNDYWKCIIRGFEHILALRNELQMVEAYATSEMEQISQFTYALTTHGISKDEIRAVHELSRRASKLFKLLVSIRSVLVAPSTYRASYAIHKFKKMTEVLDIEQIERHVEKNIQELNYFVSHYNNLVIQQNGERLQRLAIGFGFVFAFLGVASLLKDSHELSIVLQATTFREAISGLISMLWNVKILAALGVLWSGLLAFIALFIYGSHKVLEKYDLRKSRYTSL